MAVAGSNISLQAVRRDLDLSPSGSLDERQVRERIGQYGGPVKLADFADSVAGQPFTAIGNLNDPPHNRHTFTYGREGAFNNNFYSFPGGFWLRLESSQHFSGVAGNDAWTEVQFAGQIDASGTYRLTGEVATYIAWCDAQVAVASSSAGYMSGTTNLDFYKFYPRGGPYPTYYNVLEDIWLTTARPYITIILYSMNLDLAHIGNAPNEFRNMRMKRL